MGIRATAAVVAAVVVLAGLVVGAREPVDAATTTIVVRPTAMNGWAFFSEGAVSAGGLVEGPASPPAGDGSAELTVDATGRMNLATAAFAGTPLADITQLSYWTYRATADPGNNLAISLQFDVDYDLTDADSSFQGRLVFEPYQSAGGGTVPEDTWQEWDALAGKWWSSRAPFNALCPQANPCTTAQVLTNWPDAGIRSGVGLLLLRAGGPWPPGFVGNVDNLVVAIGAESTTYDFEAGPGPACTFTTAGTTMTLDGDCYTEQTIEIPDGFTLDGDGYTITAIDPLGGHFVGGVIENAGAVAHVTNVHVTTDALADVCDGAEARLRGILFDGAGGSITNNTVTNLRQGSGSGCQEGNAIEVRNAPFNNTGSDVLVTISGNTVSGYQKTGILANGSVDAVITDNSISGDGPVGYIAQNGIQIGFGGTAVVRDNQIAGNSYTGPDVACGLLMFEADGVKASKNKFSDNQQNNCDFGKGGGSVSLSE